jgi:hypothetical protein
MKSGDIVRYVRPCPEDAHLEFVVAETMDDDDGSWILLVEGEDGGYGGWEQRKEFELAEPVNELTDQQARAAEREYIRSDRAARYIEG